MSRPIKREVIDSRRPDPEAEALTDLVRCRTIRPGGQIQRAGTRNPSNPQGLPNEGTNDSLTSRRTVNDHIFDAGPKPDGKG